MTNPLTGMPEIPFDVVGGIPVAQPGTTPVLAGYIDKLDWMDEDDWLMAQQDLAYNIGAQLIAFLFSSDLPMSVGRPERTEVTSDDGTRITISIPVHVLESPDV